MRAIGHANRPHSAADEKNFVLPALVQPLLGRTDGLPIRVYRVTFGEGARTNWHSHTGPQLLQIIEGTCRFQKAGERVREAVVGDLVSIEPGERHWHGAAPASPMTHIAINIDATTRWYEPVTDAEYAG